VRSSAAADGPRAALQGAEFQFGKVVTGAVVEHAFTLRNEGAVALEVRNVRMTSPLTVTKLPARIPPGSDAVLQFKLDTSGLNVTLDAQGPGGKKTEAIVLRTSSTKTPVLTISALTDVRERIYTFPDAVDLGELRVSDIRRDPDLLRRAAQILMIYQSGGSE